MGKGIVVLGEILIDFIPTDSKNSTYDKNPGGAPANVAVGVSRLGASSTLITKVGKDSLGYFLINTLKDNNVNVKYVLETQNTKTNIVMVNLDKNGERSFEFFVNPPSYNMLNQKEISEEAFNDKNIFHFGSLTLTQEPSLSATVRAIEIAKQKGLLTSYDPNLRLSLWDNEYTAKSVITSVLTKVDILKISEEELEFLTLEKDIIKAVMLLKEKYNIKLIFVTLGHKGSYVFVGNNYAHVNALNINVVDTTGAGDAFVAGMLYNINKLEVSLEDMSLDLAKDITQFANIAGGIVAGTKGAMSGLPTKSQIVNYKL